MKLLPIFTLFTNTNETGQDKKTHLNDRKLTDACLKWVHSFTTVKYEDTGSLYPRASGDH